MTQLVAARGSDLALFPTYEGKLLCWEVGAYTSWAEEQAGYPRMRAVIRAMRVHRPEQMANERREMLKASFDRIFGNNARKVLNVIDEELTR